MKTISINHPLLLPIIIELSALFELNDCCWVTRKKSINNKRHIEKRDPVALWKHIANVQQSPSRGTQSLIFHRNKLYFIRFLLYYEIQHCIAHWFLANNYRLHNSITLLFVLNSLVKTISNMREMQGNQNKSKKRLKRTSKNSDAFLREQKKCMKLIILYNWLITHMGSRSRHPTWS